MIVYYDWEKDKFTLYIFNDQYELNNIYQVIQKWQEYKAWYNETNLDPDSIFWTSSKVKAEKELEALEEDIGNGN